MLAADTKLDVRAGGLTELASHLNELAYADLVELCERIVLVDLLIIVSAEELARVVTAETEGHLSKVVRTEGEVLCFLRDLVSRQSSSRDLDHGADLVGHGRACLCDELISRCSDNALNVCQLLDFANERDHDFRNDVPIRVLSGDIQRSLDNCGGLHLCDFRIGDSQTAATVTHHRVELVEAGDDCLNLLDSLAGGLSQQLDVSFFGRNELMQRRIEETDVNRLAFHGLVELLKVALLHRLELSKGSFSAFDGVSADHLADSCDSVRIEEHVLGTAEADAFCAEALCIDSVLRGIGIRTNLHLTELVRKTHNAAEVAGIDGSRNGRDEAVVDVAGGTIDGDAVALVVGLTSELELLVLFIHGDSGATGNTAGAHATRNNSCVGGHAAANGEDALCSLHAFDVLRGGLKANEDDLFALLVPNLCIFSGEDDLAASSTGRCSQSLSDRGSSLKSLNVELRVQQSVEVSRLDHENSLLLVDHAFVDEVASDLQSSSRRSLAVTGLEHVEVLVLDGELHVLHVSVMIFKGVADAYELLVNFRHDFLELVDVLRGADTCNNVFALCVHEELTGENLFAGGRVTGKRNAGAGGLAHVAECHHLHVNSGTPGIRDIVVAAVDVCTRVVPGTENSLDSAHELFLRIVREVLADLFLILSLKLICELLQVVSGQLNVLRYALLSLHRVDELLEVLLADFHNDVGIHLDKSSVAVISPARVAGLLSHNFNNVLVEAEVEDGIHHARHGCACTGTDGNEKRVLLIAELLAGDLLHLFNVLHNFSLDLIVDAAAVFVILGAGFGGNGEALRNGQAEVRHLSKVCALTAEKLAHARVAFCEQIDILFAHWKLPP